MSEQENVTFLSLNNGQCDIVMLDDDMMNAIRLLLLPTEEELWDLVYESWTDKAEWTADRFLVRLRAHLTQEKTT